jgi:hypothetical protein
LTILIAILPLFGAAMFARTIITTLMGLLAALSLGCARDGTATNSSTNGNSNGVSGDPIKPQTPEPAPVVTCYDMPAPKPIFANPKWNDIPELTGWAMAERSLLAFDNATNPDPQRMMEAVEYARKACSDAHILVTKGILSASVYKLAGEVMGRWHRFLATGTGQVKCYMVSKTKPDPIITDCDYWLWQLESLNRQGKINSDTANEVRASMKNRLRKDLSARDTKQLIELLNGLLEIE